MTKVISANNKVLIYNNEAMVYPEGVVPTGNINITNTAQIDVTNYATAQVVDSNLSAGNIKKDVSILGITGNYEGSGGTQYIPRRVVNGKMELPTGAYVLPSDVTILGNRAMYYAFYSSSITSADLSSLITIIGSNNNAFSDCQNLISVDLRNLTTINDGGYNYVLQNIFRNCYALTTIRLDSLSSIKAEFCLSYAFYNCTSLRTLSFPSLNSNSFGSYTYQFTGMLYRVTGCTVHFPSNLQSVIGSWDDVTGGFGGTNTTVLFDLPATN